MDKVVEDLSAAQKTLSFQSELLRCQEAASGAEEGYSLENFAYGTTPLATFQAVFSHPALRAKVAECLQRDLEYAVWGSSCGWLAFYGRLCFGLRTVGCELLGSLVDLSNEVAGKHEILTERGKGLHFERKDLLHFDLRETGILLLTSQCWDEDLKTRAYAKVASELPCGALTIDYSGGLGKLPGLRQVARLVHPVSWNSSQEFHVFVKVAEQKEGQLCM